MSKRAYTDRREELARPFAGENAESLSRKLAPPKDLLAWFLEGFRAEMPEELHTGGVWRDWARLDEERSAEGGSLLGSPRLTDAFRTFLESSPLATELAEYEGHEARDGDEHYVRPMRAALARLNGRHYCTAAERRAPGHSCPEGAMLARLLYRVAFLDGDWQAASVGFVQPGLARILLGTALYQLWRRWRPQPPARVAVAREEPAA